MKKDNKKGLDKKEKKALRRDLEDKINEQIKTVVGQLGYESKKLTKALDKNSKQLSKKLAEIIGANGKSTKGANDQQQKELQEVKEPQRNTGAPEFSSPVPVSENDNNSNANKKPVVPSDTPSTPSALEMAEKIVHS